MVRHPADQLAEFIRRLPERHTQLGAGALAELITDEGYRKPRTVTTVEELDGLPLGTNVLAGGMGTKERVWQRIGSVSIYHEWHCPDGGFVRRENVSDLLPVTVLYEPEARDDD